MTDTALSLRPLPLALLGERGTAVPFTTIQIAQMRVRQGSDRSSLALAMPGIAGSTSYVVPWKGVPDIATLTMHDRMLHQEIEATMAITPERVRRAALKVAATGLAGPQAAEAAAAGAFADRGEAQASYFFATLEAFRALGLDRAELVAAGRSKGGWQALARQRLTELATQQGLDANHHAARVMEIARVLAPIGLPDAPARLRRVQSRLIAARNRLLTWISADRTEVTELGRAAVIAADETLALSTPAFEALDQTLADLGPVLAGWPQNFRALQNLTSGIGWLLDGWDFVVAIWERHENGSAQDQRDTVLQIFRVLPTMPAVATPVDVRKANPAERQKEAPRTRQLEEWRTGRHELEQLAAIEGVKAQVMRGLPPLPGETHE